MDETVRGALGGKTGKTAVLTKFWNREAQGAAMYGGLIWLGRARRTSGAPVSFLHFNIIGKVRLISYLG